VFACLFAAVRYDLSFELIGYTFVMINNVFTAANGVYTKQKLDAKVIHWQFFFILIVQCNKNQSKLYYNI